MTRGRFILPVLLSAAVHAGLLLPGLGYEQAQVEFQRGDVAVLVRIAPSVAGRAAVTPPAPPEEPQEAPTADDAPQPVVHEPDTEPMPPLDDLTAPVPKVATEPKTASPPPDPTPTDTPRPVADAEPAPQAPVNATEVQGDRQSDGIQAEARVEGLTKPVYPMYSRRHGEEGTVVVSVEVSPDGAPRNARVVKPSGYRRLDQAALDAVKEARYVPAKRAGRPTSSLTEITFLFRLQDE